MFRRSGRFLAALLLAVSLVLGVGAVTPAEVDAAPAGPRYCYSTEWFRFNGYYYRDTVWGTDAGGRNIMAEEVYEPWSGRQYTNGWYTCNW